MARYEAVIAARDEAARIARTVESLKGQSLAPARVIVVNDGSSDGTGDIARALGCEVVELPRHAESYLGRPELATVFNAGLAEVSPSAEYVLILGADHPLPATYVRELVDYMERERSSVLASGAIYGEVGEFDVPRNSGMLARADFWRSLNGLRYPVCWGYEGWLIFTAQRMGYRTVVLPYLRSRVSRSTAYKGESDGKAMYALGYSWVYALGRCARIATRSPKDGLQMMKGFLVHSGVQRLDVADWVNASLKRRLASRILAKL